MPSPYSIQFEKKLDEDYIKDILEKPVSIQLTREGTQNTVQTYYDFSERIVGFHPI